MDNFYMEHIDGKLYVFVEINGVTYNKDITEYIENPNPIDEWLDYHLGLS